LSPALSQVGRGGVSGVADQADPVLGPGRQAFQVADVVAQDFISRGMLNELFDQWVKIGNWEFGSGTAGSVTLDSEDSLNGGDPGAVVSADAVRFALTEETTPELVVDNTDSGFSVPSTNWFPSTSVSGFLGSNYHARATEPVSDAASWSADDWEVFARWTTGGNRATAAPYIVLHDGGSTTVTADQTQNNGVWMSLGTYSFSTGMSQKVLLSCWTSSGDFVIADGIKFVKQ